MVRQARAEITRDTVLAGAATVFLRLGYANASLSEIISQSQVTKGALYFHFGSKEELA
ncbi:TetR family transcriptional regulator, partial [Rhodococcoides corynebacterioides]